MTQKRDGRRGDVFGVRLTDDERATLESYQRAGHGPRHLGPWIVWRALTAGPVSPEIPSTPARAGSTRAQPRATNRRGTTATPPRLGSTHAAPPIGERLILDLCGGSGSWSAPYLDAGYPVQIVTLPEQDVRTFLPPPRVWGVLAAPPCDQFSLARNGQKSPRDFVRGMECVNAVLRVVFQCCPAWWALENPVGKLSHWLGTPRDVFQPCDYGDPWTKRTALWGNFEIPQRGPFVEPRGGGPFCDVCDPSQRATTWCNDPAHRARTPSGFARAFCRANP